MARVQKKGSWDQTMNPYPTLPRLQLQTERQTGDTSMAKWQGNNGAERQSRPPEGAEQKATPCHCELQARQWVMPSDIAMGGG